MLGDINAIYGDIELVLAREVTKKFEEVKRDYISSMIDFFRQKKPRGEFMLVFNQKEGAKTKND